MASKTTTKKAAAAEAPAAPTPAQKAAETRKANTFADRAEAIANDVQELTTYVRERVVEISEDHADLHTNAEPSADQRAVWAAFRRVHSSFGDLDRALEQTESTAAALKRAVAVSDA